MSAIQLLSKTLKSKLFYLTIFTIALGILIYSFFLDKKESALRENDEFRNESESGEREGYGKKKSLYKKDYERSFYLPKSIEEVAQERDEYLETYGSFRNLGEPIQTDFVDSWSGVGPRGIYDYTRNLNNSGRLISFGMFGDNPNILFSGAASGGLWKSVDGGNSFTVLLDTLACPSVSSIACSFLFADNTVWFSTGAPFNGAGVQIGRVYKSINGGNSWTNIPLTGSGLIAKVEMNIYNKNHVFIASDAGLYKTTNGGVNFSLVYSPGQITDVITFTNFILPDTLNVLMARRENGIYRSTNGGLSFNPVSLPGYDPTQDGRITLATNSAGSKTFALVGKNDYNTFLGIWYSADKGATWIQKTLPAGSPGQSGYNQGLAVSASRVFVGFNAGVTLYSTDDGSTWNSSSWTHPDVHKIHVYNNTTVYSVNDGTIYKSTNSGVNYQTPSGALFLQIAQSYSLYASTSLPNKIWSGLQDNGVAGGYDNLFGWTGLTGCDGCSFFQYGGYDYMSIECGFGGDYRLQRRISTAPVTDPWLPFAQGLQSGSPLFIQTPPTDFFFDGTYFYTSMGNWAYRRSTSATLWGQLGLTSPFGNSLIGKLGYSNGYVLASSHDFAVSPGVKRYNPSSNNWENVDLTGFPSNVVVLDFEKGSSVNNIFMGTSGTSGARIFKSTNNGASWINITGNLPNLVNVRCILTNKTNDQIIYIGTDFGVFVTGNGGVNWYNYSNGLPKVCYVNGLAFENNNNNIYAATYGRGVFKSQIMTGVANSNNNIPGEFSLNQNYPNPFNPSTTIKFSLPVSDIVTMEVYDVNGRLVRKLIDGKEYRAGNHEIKFDASSFSSGVYFYRISTPKFTDVKKMILIK